MLSVELDKIIPLTEARDSLSKIISDVENEEELYVLTKGGKPAVAIVSISYIESLTGEKVEDKIREFSPEENQEEFAEEREDQAENQAKETIEEIPQPSEQKTNGQTSRQELVMPETSPDLTTRLEDETQPVPEIKDETPSPAPAIDTNPLPANPSSMDEPEQNQSIPQEPNSAPQAQTQSTDEQDEPKDMEIG